jgi:predicted ATP-grasp superfamily ATP-dependent carboligase
MPDPIEWLAEPDLREPLLIAAFGGWGDAADAATGAVRWLISSWHGERLAQVRPNVFFDFTVARPAVRLEAGGQRALSWPTIDIYQARIAGSDQDALLIHGREPHLRWPEFAQAILDLAQRCGAARVVTFGAFLGPVLHSAPVPLTGFASSDALQEGMRRLGIEPSSYQGQTSIVSVLHDAFMRAGLPSLSLWAAVPFYLGSVSPNPRATHALVEGLSRMLGLDLSLERLLQAAEYFDEQVARQIEQNKELSDLIGKLGARKALPPGPQDPTRPGGEASELPSAEAIIRDLEEFLRGRGRGEGE